MDETRYIFYQNTSIFVYIFDNKNLLGDNSILKAN